MIYVLLHHRLGNIMAELAAAASLANRLQQPFVTVIDDGTIYSDINTREYITTEREIREIILRKVKIVNSYPSNVVKIGNYDWQTLEIPIDKDVLLMGYGTIENADSSVVAKLFQIDESILEYIKSKYPIFNQDNSICSISVRRGDYLKLYQYFNVCSANYYKRAMSYVISRKPEMIFFVISEDKKWCKKIFGKYENVIIGDPETILTDMYIISLCDNHILSNSTFAKWGIQLSNKHNIIISPKPWYGKTNWEKEKKYRNSLQGKGYVVIDAYSWRYYWGVVLHFFKISLLTTINNLIRRAKRIVKCVLKI